MSTVPHIESVPTERADETPTRALARGKARTSEENADALSPLAVPVLGALFVTAGVVTSSSVLASTGIVLLVLAGGAWLMRGH
ncbi:MAG: hypothetical protein Q4G51_16315 [Dermatophilus congolensis]|nr:hypothetical protein [Dermatophilus congolensis]